MSLVLEIEYLTGTCFATIGQEKAEVDWPPQPERVFSALVATWAAHGELQPEADALEWLEKQPPPWVEASGYEARSNVASYVPPNDPQTGRNGDKTVMPALRKRQPRRFPAVRPHDSTVRFHWKIGAPESSLLRALQRLAADTSYVGHSTSLTRCRFEWNENAKPVLEIASPTRNIYAGRFRQLLENFQSGRRPEAIPGVQSGGVAVQPEIPHGAFGEDWLLFEHVEGSFDARASAIVAKTFRDAIFSGYSRIGKRNEIPEVISGHRPDGSPSRDPHMAVVPLSFVGFPHADGHPLGFALVPLRGESLLEVPHFVEAMQEILEEQEDGRLVLELKPRAGTSEEQTFVIRLAMIGEWPSNKRSLDKERYCHASRTFATATPLVLNRFPKEDGPLRDLEIVEQIVQACAHVGLPKPSMVVPGKYSAVEGSVPVRGPGNSPTWTGWNLPGSLAKRPLTHAILRFDEPVKGPVILGAGRYLGMGLCLPLDKRETQV